MSETFNLKRFFLLLRKHNAENRKRYLMSIVTAAGALVFFFTITMGSGYKQGYQQLIMQGGLIIGGAVFSSMLFRDVNHHRQGIISLSLPASHLEKFLCAWFYGVILFLPVYFLIFYCVDIAAINIANTYWGLDAQIYRPNERNFDNIMMMFLLAQSVAMLGSVAFKRSQFVHTAFLAFIVIFILLRLDNFFAALLIPGEHLAGGILRGGVWISEQGSREFLSVPESKLRLVELTGYLLPVLFWLTAFFKLKEKQV